MQNTVTYNLRITQKYLKDRWENEFKDLHKLICAELKKGKKLPLGSLQKTEVGLFDLRGFRTPKEIYHHKSNAGKPLSHPIASLRIKRKSFENFDFSFCDFEASYFFNCTFKNCAFYKARFRNCNFWNCDLEKMEFKSTDLAHASFRADVMSFNRNNSLSRVTFSKCNLTESSFVKQSLNNLVFDDCKTGFLKIDSCNINGLTVRGNCNSARMSNNRSLENLDISNAEIYDLQISGELERNNEALKANSF